MIEEYFSDFTVIEDSRVPGSNLTPTKIPNFLEMKVTPAYRYRKIYFFAQPALSNNGADYTLAGDVTLLKNRTTRSVLPASLGQDTLNGLLTGAKSLASAFSASNASNYAASRDALLVTLSAKFTVGDTVGLPDRVLLYPAYVQSDCDTIIYNFQGLKVNPASGSYTGLGFRAFLACLSQNFPF